MSDRDPMNEELEQLRAQNRELFEIAEERGAYLAEAESRAHYWLMKCLSLEEEIERRKQEAQQRT